MRTLHARLGARRRQRRGAAAIEFAFWFVAFMLILVGIIDLSYWLNIYIIIQRAARDGARHGSTVIEDPPETGIEIRDAAEDHARYVIDAAGLDCTGLCTIDSAWVDVGGRRWLNLTVAYPVESLTHLFPYPVSQVRATFSMLTQEQL